MRNVNRRDFLRLSAGGVTTALAGSMLSASFPASAATPYQPKFPIEKDAKLQLLRWSVYIQSDKTLWERNTKAFTQATGVPVRIQYINWDDVPAKSALAAEMNSGPDIFMGWYDDPFIYPDKLVDVSDLADDLGKANGGWYPLAKQYGYSPDLGRWVCAPVGAPGNAIVYRKSWVREAGFDKFPGDLDGLLKLARKLKKNGHPTGFALGHDIADANTWTHWILWAFGGKQVDESDKVAINSKETWDALDYAKALHETMIPGVSSWTGASNNRAFLSGKISLTQNGNSIWYVAQKQFPKIKDDITSAANPIGPVGHPTTFNAMTELYIFKYTRFPNAAKEYIRFMLSKKQAEPWVSAQKGYMTLGLQDQKNFKVWSENKDFAAYRDVLVGSHNDGYAGNLGSKAALALNNLVIVDMFADACTRGMSPKAAAHNAEQKLRGIYGT